jgi:FixJ family two-component response regulator
MREASHVIHVVDDDSSFRCAIARLLNAAGYEVALYATSQQLLEKPPTSMSDCILLDVQMSGLSGPQLQDRLSELGNRLPIVFLTGHADIPTSVRAIKAGAEDFLTKPVTKERLLDTIKRALEQADRESPSPHGHGKVRGPLGRRTRHDRRAHGNDAGGRHPGRETHAAREDVGQRRLTSHPGGRRPRPPSLHLGAMNAAARE